MGGARFQTQAADYCHLAITLPVNGSAVTLLSLVGTLLVSQEAGDKNTDESAKRALSTQMHRVTAVRLTGQAAAYLYGKTAATALIPVGATTDLVEPVTALTLLSSFFQSTTAGTVAITAIVYLD